jgi:hypothetical protein
MATTMTSANRQWMHRAATTTPMAKAVHQVLAQQLCCAHRVGDFHRIFSFAFVGPNLKIDAVVVACGGSRVTPVRLRPLCSERSASAALRGTQRVKPVHHVRGRERSSDPLGAEGIFPDHVCPFQDSARGRLPCGSAALTKPTETHVVAAKQATPPSDRVIEKCS